MDRESPLRGFAARLTALADAIESNSSDEREIVRRAGGALAGEFHRLRRRRAAIFGDGLFFEPAWDMLLELYAARGERREVTTTNLCLASGAPSTTALRYVALLEEAGLISRSTSPRDNRVSLIALTEDGRAKIDTLLDQISSASPAP